MKAIPKVLAGTAAALLLLAGCSSSDSDSTEATSPPAVMTTEASAPAASPTSLGDIAAVAAGAPDLSTLVTALTAAGLVETLQGPGPFTVFAPTNEAFEALPAGVLDKLVKPENKDALTSVLTYHVISGKVPSSEVTAGKVKTVEGSDITITTTDGVQVNGAKVVTADVMADNGVVHVIDAVLLPPGFDPEALK